MYKKIAFLLTLCGVVALSAVCNPYPLPSTLTGYVPFTIVNGSGSVNSDNLYITIVGTDPSTQKSCIVQINSGVGTLVDATQFMFANQSAPYTPFSYLVSSLPTQNSQAVIYLPPITNATMYISIGYGMGLNVSTSSPPSINAPQLFTTTDPNYYHLYDGSLFFTIADDLTVQSQYSNGFGLPISAIVSTNGGKSNQYTGIATTCSTLYTDYTTAVNGLMNTNSQTQWETLPISFTSAAGGGVTQLRLASTLAAMNFSPTPFDISYLFNSSSYGADWVTTVFSTQNIYFDVSGLTTATKIYTYYEYTGTTGGNLVFVPGTGCSSSCTNVLVPSNFTTSLPFLNAAATGASSFSASGDALAAPVICSYLSAGFVSGLFPASTSQTNQFGTSYLARANVNGLLYQNNAAFPSTTGPWYDLYGATLHNAATGTSYFNFEADPVDASLGFFAPISVKNNVSSQASVFVVLNNLGTVVVPNFTDSATNTINIAIGTGIGSYTLTYNGMTTPSSSVTQQFMNVPVPFTFAITYSSGIYNGQTFTSEIWVNNANDYSVVFPQPPGTLGVTMTSANNWNVGVSGSP